MSVVKKKKHVSKKNKKAWRKHCDIRDVEEFLEDQRLEERLGKFDVKPDEELFVVDTYGDEAKKEKVVSDGKPTSAKMRKRAKLVNAPKCFDILLPSSKVQDPNAKRNTVNPVGTKPTSLSKLTDQRRLQKGVYQKKIELARKNRKMALEKKRKSKTVRQTFDIDLWGQDLPEAKGIPETLQEEFMSTEAQLHNVLTDRRLRAKPPLAPNVVARASLVIPHPGVSYNPTYKDHQALLQEVVVHEQAMMKREAHIHRVTTHMFGRVTPKEKENQWREEMSSGLPTPHNPAEDPDASDSEYKAVNPPVKNKKKDHKTRRKQRERLVELERRRREKIDKKKITDLYRIRKIKSSIVSAEGQQRAQQARRRDLASSRAQSALPALNRNRAPPAEPEFVPAQLLTGDLRHMPSSSGLLRDRYQTLQRRGALAPTKLMMKKKRKVKQYFKPGHKVTEKDIEKYLPQGTKVKLAPKAKNVKPTQQGKNVKFIPKGKNKNVKVKRGKNK